MKKITGVFVTLVLLFLCGCKKEAVPAIVGEWTLTEIVSTKSAQIGDRDIYVKLSFNVNKTFEMEQIVGEGPYRSYRGTWMIERDVLSGTYDDGAPWGAAYTFSVTSDKLTLLPVDVESAETYIYTRI